MYSSEIPEPVSATETESAAIRLSSAGENRTASMMEPRSRKLERVAEQIEQNLPDAGFIEPEMRHRGRTVGGEVQPFLQRLLPEHRMKFPDQRHKIGVAGLKPHLSGFELGQVQQVVDLAEQDPPPRN